MPLATPSSVRKQIEAGRPDLVYLLQGEDDVEKSALAAEFPALIDEGLQAFNVERLHAGEMTSGDKIAAGIGSLLAAARTLPMMTPWRVIVVPQAESLLAPKRESEAASRAMGQLEAYLQAPEPQTVLVFVASSLDKRSRVYKLLIKHATVVECGVIENPADAERWIRNRVKAGGAEIDPAAARLLAAKAGTDVRRLRSEVDRLLLYTLGQKSITVDDARQIAGPDTLQDDWAMTNAIEGGRTGEALRQLALVLDAGAAPEKILGQLGWLVRSKFPTIAPAQLAPSIEALFRSDQDLKRTIGDPRIVLERLVVELCGGQRSRAVGSRY
jgi:DNA polymerase III delta subunit